MNNKTALIIGVGGQDGKILFDLLKLKNYRIIGISRDKNVYHDIDGVFESTDILIKQQVDDLISKYKPDEIYYLAAYHHSSQDSMPDDGELFTKSRETHVDGYFNILQAVQQCSPDTKICYASSCLIYGGSQTEQQDEGTLPVPNSIYGITKLEGMHLGNWYAEKYGLQVVNTILYNHESEHRSSKFVSMKIIDGAIKISKGLQDKIILGNLSTQVDRGYAGDYVKAMHSLLQTDKVGDYIISSGSLHTIQDLVEIVFDYLHLDWKQHIVTDQSIIQRKKGLLFGDNTKLKEDTEWKLTMNFEEMVFYIIDKVK